MSQFPPPPPQQMPPAAAYPAPAPKRTNGAAIASLVCGLVSCIPFVTGLAAIVLGIFGIKKAKDPQVGGKGMALAGLILGLVSLAVWALFVGGISALLQGTSAEREVARQFITDLAAGNIDAAQAQTDGRIPREKLDKWSKTMQGWGKLNDTTIMGVSAEPGKTQIAGSATFGTTPKGFEALVLKQPDGSYKVSDLTMK